MHDQKLIDQVLEQIRLEVESEDLSAIEGLLMQLSACCIAKQALKNYLPEDNHESK